MNPRTYSNNGSYGRILIILVTVFTLLLLVPFSSRASIQDTTFPSEKGNSVISAYELHKMLTDRFGFVSIKLSDAQYLLPDSAMIDQLKNSGGCSMQTSSDGRERWGDDDYAIAAMVPMRNYAFGTVFLETSDGEKKVLNVFINSNREIVYWEAKTCRYYEGRLDKAEFMLF